SAETVIHSGGPTSLPFFVRHRRRVPPIVQADDAPCSLQTVRRVVACPRTTSAAPISANVYACDRIGVVPHSGRQTVRHCPRLSDGMRCVSWPVLESRVRATAGLQPLVRWEWLDYWRSKAADWTLFDAPLGSDFFFSSGHAR